MNCKICGEHLYKEMDLRVLFKWNYKIHLKCKVYKFYDLHYEIIPVENNIIEFVYLLPNKLEIDEEHFFFFFGYKYFEYINNKSNWSIIYWYEENDYESLPDIDRYFLLQLAVQKILFFSIWPY